MADTAAVANANTTTGVSFATDRVTGVDWAYSKMVWGPSGTINHVDVAAGLALPTQIRSSAGTELTLADNAAFTDGTSPVVPAGFVFDETAGSALTENDAAAARVDSKRSQVMVIEDATTRGRRVTVSSGGELLISASTLPLPTGAATEATLAAMSAKLPAALGQLAMVASLSVTLASNQTALAISAASLPLPSGASTAAKQPALGVAGTASADVITVQGIASMTPLLVNGSGVTQPVSNAGTFAVQAAQSGTWTVQPGNTANTTAWLMTGTGGTFPVTDSNGSLTVDAPVGTPVFVRLSDGTSAITTLAVSIASVPSHAVTNAGVFAVQVDSLIPGVAATSLGKAEDAVAASGDTGIAILAVRRDSASSGVSADGDYANLSVDSTGALRVTGAGGSSGTQYAEDAAHVSGDSGTLALVVRRDANTTMVSADGDYAALQVDSSGSLKVAIISGAGSGGTAMTDDAAYTVAVTSFTPVGGTYRSSLDSVDDGDGGAFSMTATRALMVNLRDASGNEVSVGGGTQYDEDTAHVSGDKMTMAGVVRRDTAASSSGTDGDRSTLNTDASGKLWTNAEITVALPTGSNVIGAVTQSGTWTNQVVGTVAHDGVAAGNPILNGAYASATAPTAVSADGDMVRLWADLNGRLQIGDGGGSLTVDGTVTTTPPSNASTNVTQWAGTAVAVNSGSLSAGVIRVTLATDQVQLTNALKVDGSAVTQPVSGTVTVNAGTNLNTSALALDATLAAQSLVDNAAFTDGTTRVTPAGFIFDEAAGTALTENDAGAARMDSKRAQVLVIEDETTRGRRLTITAANAMKVDGSGVTQPISGTVTANAGTGTFTVGGVAAHDAVASGNPNLIAGYASAAAPTNVSADGDVVRAWFLQNGARATVLTAAGALIGGDATNGLDVDVTRMAALVAGSATIGSIADITTSVTPGTGAGHLGKAEDAAHTSGDTGVMSLAVRRDANTTMVSADGDYSPLQVDATGSLKVAIISGAGSGGTAMVDDAAFTVAVTSFTPIGGTYRSSRDAVDSGDGGAFAMTATRALFTAIETPNGDSAMDDTNDAVRVNVVAGALSGYAEDAAAASGDSGMLVLAVRQDTISSSTSADGDYGSLKLTSTGRLWASVVLDTAIPAGTNNIGDVDVLTVPSDPFGANADAASATGSISAKLRFIASTGIPITGTVTVGSHAVTNAGTFAVQATLAAGATNIAKAEDVASADADVGVPSMAVRKATPANTSGTDGDYEFLQMSAGRLWTSATIDTALPAGTNKIGTVTDVPATSGGYSVSRVISAATTNATSAKGSAGQVFGLMCSNINAAPAYLKIYNKATAPTVGTDTPIMTILIPGNTAGGGLVVEWGKGIAFATGIAYAITTGATDANTGAVAANEVIVNLMYV